MEVTEAPSGGSPLWAQITGIQFGLMTSTDIRTMSVAGDPEGSVKPKDRMNAYLGLPTANGPCLTCQGITVDQCQGHFGHIQLPLPIFHPNHVETLVQVLRKICLNCGQLRKKNKAPAEPNTNGNLTEACNNQPKKRKRASTSEDSDRDHKGPSSADAKNKQKVEDVSDEDVYWPDDFQENVVVLSSSDSDEDMNGKPKHVQAVEVRKRSGQLTSQGAAEFPANSEKITRKRKFPSDLQEFSSKSAPKFPASNDVPKGSASESYKRAGKFPKQVDKIAKNATKFGDKPKPQERKCLSSPTVCKYCSASSRRLGYPDPVIRVHVTSGGTSSEDPLNLVKVIKMRVNPKDQENLALDFWDFVEGSSKSQNKKSSRYLLPSEALTILKKIPQKSFSGLGMNAHVARPEALILECIPIPPNCTRLQDYAFGPSGTNIGFKMGVDRATQTFERLLRKINSISTSRFSKPAFQAALTECSVLQALFQHYLREKGAPKAAPGKEKKKVDNSGRLQKRASRWSLEWLKENIIGKRSGFSARNVVTGDPFLSVEEVGIPLDIAKHVTCSERVTEFNRSILQRYIQIGQELGPGNSRACGAVRIVRDGERREVTRKTGIELEIGDIVHRHLKDGDLVFINRPPSLHKHSLLALKARIHTEATWTINPAICAPLHADFDGDCLHLFVPQTEDSRAELHQLMTLPAHILPSPDENTILGLSQDYILASYLVTSSPVFVTKEEMHQLGLWTTRRIPVPTVVRSPKGGPLWTGNQVIDLTIPEKLSFQSSNKATTIQGGELISCGEKPNWLASTKGLVRIVALHHADAAVKHIDCSQSVLREWLLTRGFSVSLEDFFAAPNHFQRSKLKQEMEDSLEYAKCMAVGKQLIFDKRIQTEEELQSRPSLKSTTRSSGCSTTRHDLENVAITCFQRSQSQIVETMVESISDSNCLLAMLRSGSKGSSAKVMQQIGSLGIQVTYGDKLLSIHKNSKLVALAKARGYSFESDSELQDVWETRGLVKSSLLDGLEPHEFFTHAIAVRDGIFRQSQEIAGPGELFKRLMLFLRDVHVAYDGTVRNRGNLEIIQFQYEGAKSLTEEDTSMNAKETVMPGEAVGILAATAFSQPAYQIMLEASPGVGSRKVRPFDLLQESMYPRSKGKLKASDRRAVLRLSRCDCDEKYCEERRILDLQAELQPVTLGMLATATAIEYASESSERWETFDFGARKINQTQLLPWIGHLQLDKMVLFEKKITPSMILERLEGNVKVIKAVSRRCRVGGIIFCFRDLGDCDLMTKEDHGKASDHEKVANGLCLHFSLLRSIKRKKRNLKTVKHIDDESAEMLKIVESAIIPMFLSTVIKGSEKIERTNIVWEDEAWSPPRISGENDNFSDKSGGELVLEVTIKEVFCTRRGMPWKITQESCLQMMDHVDWQRSSPYSIQEIRSIFGVVAAHDVLEERFELAAGQYIGKKHIKLVADLMAHSGEIHGLTSHGYRDWMRSLRISAPLTAGVFRAPMKHFMEAGRKGMTESFKGVLASSVFGKTVPVGTGADFMVNLSVTPHLNSGLSTPLDSTCLAGEDSAQSIDILERLIHLNSKIAAEYPPITTSTHEESNVCDTAQVQCQWGATPSELEGEWGARADASNRIPIEACGSWAVDEKDPNQTGASGTNNDNSQSGTQNGVTEAEGGGWSGFDNRSEKSPIVASGSFGVGEKDTNQTEALQSSDCNSQWGSQDLVTVVGGGWGCLEAETSNPSGNCAAKEKETNNQTNAWGANDGQVQWVSQNAQTAGGGVWGSTEVETSNPSGNWG